MALNVYEQIYNKLNKLTGGLEKPKSNYLKLKAQGYMDLVIECIGNDVYSLAHYYENNGDLVPDPDITVKVDVNNKTGEALSFQNCYVYQQVYPEYPETNKVNLKLKKELNTFMNQWLTCLKKQGFYK